MTVFLQPPTYDYSDGDYHDFNARNEMLMPPLGLIQKHLQHEKIVNIVCEYIWEERIELKVPSSIQLDATLSLDMYRYCPLKKRRFFDLRQEKLSSIPYRNYWIAHVYCKGIVQSIGMNALQQPVPTVSSQVRSIIVDAEALCGLEDIGKVEIFHGMCSTALRWNRTGPVWIDFYKTTGQHFNQVTESISTRSLHSFFVPDEIYWKVYAESLSKTPEVQECRFKLISSKGKIDICDERLMRLLRQDNPESIEVRLHFIAILMKAEKLVNEKFQEAIREAADVLQFNPNSIHALMILAQILFMCFGDLAEPIRLIKRAIALDPTNIVCKIMLYLCFEHPRRKVYSEREKEEIRGYFIQGISIQPDLSYHGLGQLFQEEGELKIAKLYFEQAILHQSADSTAPIALSAVLYCLGNVEEARQILEKNLQEISLKKEPRDWNIHAGLYAIHKQSGNNTQAADHLAKAVTTSLRIPRHNELGRTFAVFKEFEQAKKCFEKMIELDPNCAFAYAELADAERQLGNFEIAIKHFEKALRLDPGYTFAEAHLKNIRKSVQLENMQIEENKQ